MMIVSLFFYISDFQLAVCIIECKPKMTAI